MNRFLQTLLIVSAFIAPVAAHSADNSALPTVIQSALHDAAGTGNPLVVDAVADRMGTLFPSYRAQIDMYVSNVVAPATLVMASVDTMLADLPPTKDQGFAMLFDPHQFETQEDHAAEEAQDLNDIEVGSGNDVSTYQ